MPHFTTVKIGDKLMTPRKHEPAKPVSSLRFAAIKDLTSGGKASVAETAKNLGKLLASAQTKGSLRLSLIEGGDAANPTVYDIPLGGKKSKSTSKAAARPTIELITTPETWMEIAAGRLAPHDAFFGGRMRVRGKAFLAQRLLKHIAGSPGRTYLCREEE
jgi:putative sterol carrier protein